ncbi:MAG TPA: hypothetical protein PLD87_10065 [Bacteroidia bacterium]|nr:hypothetical protein [Bacteroidia bacterium]
MKTLLFFLGAACGIILMGLTTEPCEPVMTANKEACFILEMVSHDPFLQKYILSPTERERTKEARKQFEGNKK